jgi:rhamnulokinase
VWSAGGETLDYSALMAAAEAAPAHQAWIDPDDPLFFTPGDMPARIREYCQRTGQPVPQTQAEIIRCALESLALKYRVVLEQLIEASGQPVDVIHIVGGGAQNPLLNQMTADATHRPVLAGPTEATTLGNALVQLIARGELRDLAQAREVVRATHPPTRYEPRDGARWDEAYAKFVSLTAG